MITDFFISLLVGLINVVSFIVPAIDFTPITNAVSGASGTIFQWMAVLDPVINVPVLFACVGVTLTVLTAGLVFRVANYIFNHIPLIGAFG